MTVGEFVAVEAGRMPEPGEQLEIRELSVEIESVENGRIASAIVAPPRLDEDAVEGEAD